MKFLNLLTVIIAFSIFIHGTQSTAAITIKSEITAEKFEEIDLLKSSSLQVDKTEVLMTQVSHGLRKKAIFGLVPVRVYVLQLLASKPEKLVKTEDGVLKSLKDAGPIQLNISFLRTLPGSKISEAFKEGLESNKVNIKNLSPELEQTLKEVAAIKEFKKNDAFSITVDWKDKKASVYLQQGSDEIKAIAGSEEFAEQFLSIWFGHPSDSKLSDLKKELIK